MSSQTHIKTSNTETDTDRTHTRTDTHRHAQTRTDTHGHERTRTDTHRRRRRRRRRRRQRRRQSRRQRRRQSRRQTEAHTHNKILAHNNILTSLTRTRRHARADAQTQTQMQTRASRHRNRHAQLSLSDERPLVGHSARRARTGPCPRRLPCRAPRRCSPFSYLMLPLPFLEPEPPQIHSNMSCMCRTCEKFVTPCLQSTAKHTTRVPGPVWGRTTQVWSSPEIAESRMGELSDQVDEKYGERRTKV